MGQYYFDNVNFITLKDIVFSLVFQKVVLLNYYRELKDIGFESTHFFLTNKSFAIGSLLSKKAAYIVCKKKLLNWKFFNQIFTKPLLISIE